MFKQFTRVLVGISLAAGIAATVAACTSSSNGGSSTATTAPTTEANGGGSMAGGSMSGGSMSAPHDSGKDTMVGGKMMSRYGGPIYSGAPALSVTAALVAAGGGPAHFSTATALTAMVGKATVAAEVKKLSAQYGAANVAQWLKTFDFAVTDALKIATAAKVSLPAPDPKMTGKALATTLVKAGTAPDGTFQIEYLLDKAVSHKIHVQVMDDIDANPAYGKKVDLQYHEISNQAFYDVAEALGASVKLSSLH